MPSQMPPWAFWANLFMTPTLIFYFIYDKFIFNETISGWLKYPQFFFLDQQVLRRTISKIFKT
jgi:hypothetical protein